jgi:Ala-tRNA(Pro) deacylase
MPCPKLKELLDAQGVAYRVVSHPTTYTAQLTAASAHVAPEALAKTVMVNVDGSLAMAVLPAASRVDLVALHGGIGAESVRLAGELEFKERFPDCDAGAMPPFGSLYGMKVYVDEALTGSPEIAFNAGSHTEVVCMAYRDFERLARPEVLKFAGARARAAAAMLDDRLW